MDHHESAAAEIAGARIGDRERETDRDRGVHRVAAAVEDLDTDAGGALLLRHHHAVVREDRGRRRNGRRALDRCDLGKREGYADEKRQSCRHYACHHWFRIHPLVPAKAGTQFILSLPGFPLARE